MVGTGLSSAVRATTPTFLSDSQSANAIVSVGLTFTLTPRDVAARISTQLTIVGNQTGASLTIPVIVNPKPTV